MSLKNKQQKNMCHDVCRSKQLIKTWWECIHSEFEFPSPKFKMNIINHAKY